MTICLAPMEWSDLADIDDVAPLGPDDDACLADLLAVLERHGRVDRFGVQLLHSHFSIAADERLVESVDLHNRTLTLQPMTGEMSRSANLVGTSWRLSRLGATVVAECRSSCIKSTNGGHVDKGHRAI